MSPLFAPILAQLVTLSVGDRTEARYLESDDKRFEASTDLGAVLAFRWRRADLSLSYGPSLLLTPLERQPRELLVFHNAAFGSTHRWHDTSVSLLSNLSFGDINFRVAALRAPGARQTAAGPGAGGAEPTTGEDGAEPAQPSAGASAEPAQGGGTTPDSAATPQVRTFNRSVRYFASTTTLSLSHELNRHLSLGSYVAYTIGGGMDAQAQADYPVASGWQAGASGAHIYRLSVRDSFSTSLSAQQAWSSNGNVVTTLLGNEDWSHALGRRTSSTLGAGVSLSRFSQDNGLEAISVFPTFTAGLGHEELLARGNLSLGVVAYSAPALDPLRATIDPRVGVGSNIGWSRDRFSMNASGGAALSIADPANDAGAIDSLEGAFITAYRVSEGVLVDAGIRGAAQDFQDTATLIPPSWACFVGVSFGHEFQLKGGR